MLLFPFLWVGVGVLCGLVVVTICRPPKELARTVIAACAFGNSTGLPIVLLTAIAQAGVVQFPTTIDVATQQRGFLLLLSIYQITYPMIQWSVGGRLLVPAIAKENIKLESGQVVDLPASISGELSRSASPSLSNKLRNSWASLRGACCSQVKCLLQAFLVPPVVAVLVGTAIGAVPVLKSILVDTNGDGDAYLQWLFDAVETVGKAAVPLNMMLLGSSLASIPSFSDIHWPSTLGVAVGKLVLYPAIVYAIMFSLHRSGVTRIMVPHPTIHPQLVVVACLVSATPTANNLTVMAELAGGPACKRALAGMIFVMYCAAPFLLTAWIVAFVALEQIG
jgi:predicted permease